MDEENNRMTTQTTRDRPKLTTYNVADPLFLRIGQSINGIIFILVKILKRLEV